MGRWSQVWRSQAQDWVFARLRAEQTPGLAARDTVAPDSAYLSAFLKSARIADVRRGLKRFYGTVHSHIRLPHRSAGTAEFSVVTNPSALENVDAQDIDRVIQLNQRLLGPVPYVGGDLEIEVGLFSIASSDLAGPYLSLLESLSVQAGVAFVGLAGLFARPLVEGINLLAGASTDSILEIGISATLSPPTTGYFVVMRAPKGAVDVDSLSVDPNDDRLLDARRQPFVAYPYMVIELRAEAARDDWFRIPAVADAYADVQREYRSGRQAQADEAATTFRRVALTSNDLLPADAMNLAEKVRVLYESSTRPTTRSFGQRRELPDLAAIDLHAGEAR